MYNIAMLTMIIITNEAMRIAFLSESISVSIHVHLAVAWRWQEMKLALYSALEVEISTKAIPAQNTQHRMAITCN